RPGLYLRRSVRRVEASGPPAHSISLQTRGPCGPDHFRLHRVPLIHPRRPPSEAPPTRATPGKGRLGQVKSWLEAGRSPLLHNGRAVCTMDVTEPASGVQSPPGWSKFDHPGRQTATFRKWRPGWSENDHPERQSATSPKWRPDPPTDAAVALTGT